MKKNLSAILTIALSLSALLLSVASLAGWVKASPFTQEDRGVPATISYQGQIFEGEAPYSGTGYFKFAFVDPAGVVHHWTNDGLRPPVASVPLQVNQGLFSVLLGDTSLPGMTEPLSVGGTGSRLKVWFSPTGGEPWTVMPLQVIASVPYALIANYATESEYSYYADVSDAATHAYTAGDADKVDGLHASSFQLRVSGTCPVGYAVRAIEESGGVTCELLEPRPVHSVSAIDLDVSYSYDNSMALGTDGLALVSYKGLSGGLKVAHCNNTACTAATTSTLESGNQVGNYSDIAIGADGLGVISYLSSDALKVAHCNDIACTTATITTLDPTEVSYYTSIAIGSDGYPLIAFHKASVSDLKVAHCTNFECSTFSINTWSSANSVGIYNSIAVDKDGLPLIAYRDTTSGALAVAHCDDVACTSAVFTTHFLSGYPHYISLAIGTDGLGLISYTDGSRLKIAHCDNTNCSSATYTTIDLPGTAEGSHSSITIGQDGLGLISHSGTNSLLVSHCDNLVCSSASTNKVASIGGGESSIIIGTDGFGLISKYSSTTNDLFMVHCSNRFCVPYARGD